MKKVLYLLAFILTPLFTMAQSLGSEVGDKIYEISGSTPDDQTISLSQLKGKLVLVDFWASWCPPCRAENPNIAKAYSQFKDKNFTKGKGFEVFQISLDSKKADWTKAIDKDQLVWPCHICDFKGWYSPIADQFGIEEIPSNLLIDKDGIIIAKDLRDSDLETTLQGLMQ